MDFSATENSGYGKLLPVKILSGELFHKSM
jgi:hypothetical protein